jgi:protein-tyrosine phosphatase
LDQLKKILGAEVKDSVGDFAHWLIPDSTVHPPETHRTFSTEFEVDGAVTGSSEADEDVLSFLYRDASKVHLKPLSGGYSGAKVFKAASQDALGHDQAPSVAKIGPRALIGAERAAFERVEEILGNNAPNVRAFVDLGERAGIKFSFAAMGRGEIRTFQSIYQGGLGQRKVDAILAEVFEEIMEPFYAAAQFERLPLLEHYTFSPQYAESTKKKVARIHGHGGDRDTLPLPGGGEAPNPASFYSGYVRENLGKLGEYHYVSFVHGDLNGANILVDSRDNVWIIDFFHTERAHVLKDLIKLENDILYIYTPVPDEKALAESLNLTRSLLDVGDLGAPLPRRPTGVKSDDLMRAWATLRTLRSFGAEFVREDRNPQQAWIPMLRYAMHTLSFDESDALQKRWALASSALVTDRIERTSERNRDLRIAWIGAEDLGSPGRLGLTICPGRRDHGRDLEADLATIRKEEATLLIGLLTEDELEWAGVPEIGQACKVLGIEYVHHPIPDQDVPSVEETRQLGRRINDALDAGRNVVVHCMGGLGRTGTVAACAIQDRGFSAEEAVEVVRQGRGPRAIETEGQERFVREYEGGLRS